MATDQQDPSKVLELLSTDKAIKTEQLADYLRTYKENADITTKTAALILSRLESSRSKKSELKEVARSLNGCGCIAAMKDVLEAQPNNSLFTETAYHIVGLLSRLGHAEVLLSLEKSGFVHAASQAICDSNANNDDSSNPLWVTYALAGLATSKTCTLEICKRQDTVTGILRILSTHNEKSDDVVLHALSIISSIAHFSSETAVHIASNDSLGIILEAIKFHAAPGPDTYGDICMLALQFLCNAAKSAASAAASIVIGGGIAACIDAMKAWPDNAEDQRWGCSLLGLLARAANAEKEKTKESDGNANVDGEDEISACGGIAAIVNALKMHPNSQRVLRQAMKTLGIIASQNATTAELVAFAISGAESTIATAMRRFKDDSELLGTACFAIASIAGGCSEAGKRLLAAGAGDIALYALRVHRDVDRIQHYGCAALAALATADPVTARKRLLGNKALELTTDIMRTAADFGRAQASACSAILSYLGSDAASVRSKLFQLGVPALIASAMERFPESAEVHEAALGLLAALASDRDTAAKLGDTLITRAIEVLGHFESRADIQARCCAFLVGASSKIPANNSIIAAARGAEAVLAAMAAHPSDVGLQALCCRCLANFGHEAESRSTMGYGGIEAVLAAVSRHSGYPDLRHWACIALANSTCGSLDNQLMFVAKGGLEFAVKTVNAPAGTPLDKSTRYFALMVLANVCSEDARTRHILRSTGGLEAILAFLRDERNEQAQIAGLRALALATKGTKTNALLVGQLGGIALVLPALRHFVKVTELQEWGLCALEHITFNVPENQQVHWPGSAAETILRSIKKNRGSPKVVLYGLRILANVAYGTQNEGNTADIRKNVDGLKAIVTAMKEHSGDPEVQRWGCVVFQTLAAVSGEEGVAGRAVLVQVRAVDAIYAAIAAHKAVLEVQECALYALACIFVASPADKKKALPNVEWAAAAFPSSKVLADILALFKSDSDETNISNIIFSPYGYNRSLRQKNTADVCSWIESLGLRDADKVTELIKKYSIDGSRLFRISTKDELTKFGIDNSAASMIFNNVRQLRLAQQQRFSSIGRPMYTPAAESPISQSIDTLLGEGPFVPFEEAITAASTALQDNEHPSDAQMTALRSIAESVCGREEAGTVGITIADALSIAFFLQENVCTKLNCAIAERNSELLHSLRGFVLHLVTALRKLPMYKESPVLYKAVKRSSRGTLAEIAKNRVLVWPGFVSATCDEEAVLEFLSESGASEGGSAEEEKEDERLLVEIRGNFVGYNVRSFTGCGGEDEIVLEPETTFKIVDVQRDIQFPTVRRVIVEVSEPLLALRSALSSFHA